MAWFKREKSRSRIRRRSTSAASAPKVCGRSAIPAARSSGKRTSRRTGKFAPSAIIISVWAPAAGSTCCSMMSHGPNSTPSLRSTDPLQFHRSKALRAAPAGSRAKTRHEGRHHHRRRESRRPPGHLLLHGVRIHRRLDGRGGRRKSGARHRALARASANR